MKFCDYTAAEWKRKCCSKAQCKATKIVRIKYKPMEEDVLYLCDDCVPIALEEARSKGWQIKIRDMTQI
jgi:hypothetical protein